MTREFTAWNGSFQVQQFSCEKTDTRETRDFRPDLCPFCATHGWGQDTIVELATGPEQRRSSRIQQRGMLDELLTGLEQSLVAFSSRASIFYYCCQKFTPCSVFTAGVNMFIIHYFLLLPVTYTGACSADLCLVHTNKEVVCST